MNKGKSSSTALLIILYLFAVWISVNIADVYSPTVPLFSQLPSIIDALSKPFDYSFNAFTIPFILFFTALYGTAAAAYYASEGKRRMGEEHGSAKWGQANTIRSKYGQNKNDDILLTSKARMGLDTYKHKRNLNVLVIGGSGSGKTRYYAKPNLMQCNTSFVVTDPKSEMLRSTGHLLIAKGYKIKVLNLIDFAKSDGYNPFKYIRDDKDVLKLITNLVTNTTPKTARSGDPFWEKAEIALLQALMFYLIYEAPIYEQHFGMIMTMLSFAGASEADESYESALDLLFKSLETENPEHIAVKQYRVYKQAAGKTAKSILISLAVRLSAFNLKQLQAITKYDEMAIPSLGNEKTALFAVIPDNDTSFNFLVGMLYTQILSEAYYQADHLYGGRLPVPVHFIMDEFANVALPESFDKCLSTMRSRNINASIILQNLAQLKGLFKGDHNAWETITGNCDSLLYLGGNEQSTHVYISKLLGKSTIDTRTYGHTRGRSGSYSTNKQITGRDLLTPEEVRLLDNDYALLFVRGDHPVCDKKYNLLKHKNIEATSDGTAKPYIHHSHNIQTKSILETIDLENAENYIVIDES